MTKVKTYVQASAAMSSVQNSIVFNQLGFDINSRNKAKEQILISFNKLQKLNRSNSPLRSNHTDEWTLVFVEEQTTDKNVVQPYSTAKTGYPGSVADGGYLVLPKNFIVNFKGYHVNEDGSEGELSYLIHFNSYTVKNNLPVDVQYSSFYADYEADAEGNLLDYTDHGTFHYEYISGCNQKLN